MKKALITLLAILGLLAPTFVFAQTNTHQGGTGLVDISAGSIPFGSVPNIRLATSSLFQWSTTLKKLTFTNASSSALTSTNLYSTNASTTNLTVQIPSCSGGSALTTNASGVVACGTITPATVTTIPALSGAVTSSGASNVTAFGVMANGVLANALPGSAIPAPIATSTLYGAGGIPSSALANTTVTPGSYTLTSITVNAQGQITAASNGSAGTAASSTLLQDQNTWTGLNRFNAGLFMSNGTSTGSFAVTASSTIAGAFNSVFANLLGSTTLLGNSLLQNATTSTFAITGALGANCNGTNALTTNSAGTVTCTAQPQGTVTTASVVTANGFAGSVANPTTAPAITLTTTVTGLLLGNATAVSAYGGATCPYGILTLNASGAASVCNTYMFPSNSTSTPSFTILYASSTAHSISGELSIPNAANPTVANPGDVAIDTTAASSSLHFVTTQGNEFAVFASTSVAFTYATTTPLGTSTVVISGATRKVGYYSMGCITTGVGTANVQLGNGTASTTMVIASNNFTTVFTTLVGNNVFGQGQARLFAIGTFSATTVTGVSCSLMQGYDPN